MLGHVGRQWLLVCWLIVIGCIAQPQRAYAGSENISIAGLEVAVWTPGVFSLDRNTPPLILSHGIGGCNNQFNFLTQRLSDEGYAVFVPTHKDSRCNLGGALGSSKPPVSFNTPQLWSDKVFADRRDDIKRLIDALQVDSRYQGFDWNRLGMFGFSLGGYTALGLAGGWPSWKDSRIKAVLALSPYASPYLVHNTIGNIDVPVMYQGGTRDWLNDDMRRQNGLYDQTRAPVSYLELNGAVHVTWSDAGRGEYKSIISDYSVAFFDYYLKGKAFPEELMQKKHPVSDLRLDRMAPVQAVQ